MNYGPLLEILSAMGIGHLNFERKTTRNGVVNENNKYFLNENNNNE